MTLPLADGEETRRIEELVEAAGQAGARGPGGAGDMGPGDDAATFGIPAGARVVLSSDASVEGVHFHRAWMTWEVIGYRATAAALSDLAAMAATPVGGLVSLALPPELDAPVAQIGRGIGEALGYAGGALLGGDLVASPGPVVIDVCAAGWALDPVSRAGARPGDEVWVTGSLGGAAAAVADLRGGLEPTPGARTAFERPRPRIREAAWLAERGVLRAAIDLSDGLARDARHLARASGVGIVLDWESVPAHGAVAPYRSSPSGRRLVLSGGEDYELLLAAPPGALERLAANFERTFDVPLTRVGAVVEGEAVEIVDETGSPLEAGFGFDHFAGGD